MDLLESLNAEQKEAVTHESGPLLIVAGAGTGKTTVITRRIAHLIETGKANSDEILAVTFTEKAAAEMEERVEALLPMGYADLWISTFHAFCERVLKESALEIGLPNDFKLVNTTEAWLLVRQKMDRFELDYYKPLGSPTKFIQAMIQHFSRVKDENISPEEYVTYAENLTLDKDASEFRATRDGKSKEENDEITEASRVNELAHAYATYQQILLENSALDFGDLITSTLKLFKERPKILKAYQEQFKYILVDEFQDTNYAQYELVKMLAPSTNNLTVVGDDDQSLYRFRGASVSNIFEFKKDFPDSKEVLLVQNYRSTQNILDLAYTFIQLNNPYRLEYQLQNGKEEEAKDLVEQIQEKGKQLETKITKKLKANTEADGMIEHLHFETQEDEANGVVKRIAELRGAKGLWSDFAILVRANDYADQFIQSLEREEIPYEFLASRGLFQKPIILDMLAFLRLLDNYHESSAVWRVLGCPMWALAPIDTHTLIRYANKKSKSVFEAMLIARAVPGLTDTTREKIEKILQMVERLAKETREKRPSSIILKLLQDSGYLEYLNKLSVEDEQAARDHIMHLEQFMKFVSSYERSSDAPSVKGFIEEVNLAIESGDTGSLEGNADYGPESVKILTIHGSKGLEFKYVFVVHCVDKRFPSIGRREPIEVPAELIKEIVPEGDVHLQEERRLFYVAVTRAREGIFFSSAEDYGGARKKKLSRFLVEAKLSEETRKAPAPSGKVFFSEPKKKKTLHASSVDLPKPTTYSYSQINSFRTCPYQYRFAHIIKIPIPGKPSFSFGNTIHGTLHEFFKRIQQQSGSAQNSLFEKSPSNVKPKAPSLDELLEIYDQHWIDDWYSSKREREEYKKKGRQYLKDFYESHDADFPIPKYLEKGFHLRVGDYMVRGFIDRVDAVGDGVKVIDYKTGKPKTGKTADFEQLHIYALAARESLNENPEELSYLYIEGNTKVTIEPDEKKLAKVKEQLQETIEKIQKSDFTATPSPFICRRCDYNKICEFSKAK